MPGDEVATRGIGQNIVARLAVRRAGDEHRTARPQRGECLRRHVVGLHRRHRRVVGDRAGAAHRRRVGQARRPPTARRRRAGRARSRATRRGRGRRPSSRCRWRCTHRRPPRTSTSAARSRRGRARPSRRRSGGRAAPGPRQLRSTSCSASSTGRSTKNLTLWTAPALYTSRPTSMPSVSGARSSSRVGLVRSTEARPHVDVRRGAQLVGERVERPRVAGQQGHVDAGRGDPAGERGADSLGGPRHEGPRPVPRRRTMRSRSPVSVMTYILRHRPHATWGETAWLTPRSTISSPTWSRSRRSPRSCTGTAAASTAWTARWSTPSGTRAAPATTASSSRAPVRSSSTGSGRSTPRCAATRTRSRTSSSRSTATRAISEAYVTVCLRNEVEPGHVVDIVGRGRYVDRWSRRDGRWAIDHRRYVDDLTNVVDVPGVAP